MEQGSRPRWGRAIDCDADKVVVTLLVKGLDDIRKVSAICEALKVASMLAVTEVAKNH